MKTKKTEKELFEIAWQNSIELKNGAMHDSNKEYITRIDYANNGEGFYLGCAVKSHVSTSPYYCVIGYTRDEAAWKFTKTVNYGIRRMNINGERRFLTWEEMRQRFFEFCNKNSVYYAEFEEVKE